MKKFLFAITFILPLLSFAQYKVTFKVKVPQTDVSKKISFASTLNNWTPGAAGFELKNTGENNFEITMPDCPANFKGKFTCGSWKTVECTTEEKDVSDRVFDIISDTTIYLEVAAFRQPALIEKYDVPRSPQVIVVNDSFYLPQLNAKRRIWMYVPKSYDSKKRYPVLYMHDGQNLFDNSIAFAGEWGVDEYLDSTKKECIVIGIDNGGDERMQEYNAYDNTKFGKGKGKLYTDFIVQTLKPYVDKNYATLKEKKNTFIAGSSMGGLISYYAALKYPNTFGKIGVFSPSFWICMPEIKKELAASKITTKIDFYFYSGWKETESLFKEIFSIKRATKLKCPTCNTEYSVSKDGIHNEQYWRKELPKFFDWIFNGQTKSINYYTDPY